jgi:chromosome segregation ATPase
LLQARLEEASTTISDLEEQNRDLQENNTNITEELTRIRQEHVAQASEIATLRDRANLSQQNWIKERDELISREAYAREEFENAKQAMQDWEALALNERSLHDNLKEKMGEFEEQLDSLRDAHRKAVSERDQNSEAVDGLQKALQRLQTGKLLPP